MKRVLALFLTLTMILSLSACGYEPTASETDSKNTINVASKLAQNQPTPTDIEYSLERYNLIRRAYWVNGMRERARTLECPVVKPLGYVVLLTESGMLIGQYCVDGKVSSLNSYLSPDSEVYEVEGETSDYSVRNNGTTDNDWIADVDGSYGSNDNGIFFFTPDGSYKEWNGHYLYSDVPFHIEQGVLIIQSDDMVYGDVSDESAAAMESNKAASEEKTEVNGNE